jgi:hypothetical protein
MEMLADYTLAQASLDDGRVSNFVCTYEDVDDPYTEPPIRFASHRVHDLVRIRKDHAGKRNFAARLENSRPLGYDFENIGIHSIFKRVPFPIRRVRGTVRRGEQQQQQEQLHLSIDAKCTKNETKDIHAILKRSGALHVHSAPRSRDAPRTFPLRTWLRAAANC